MNCIQQHQDDKFSIYQGDCCDVIAEIPDHSVDFSVFSPPFAELYCYSDSERDMGNSRNYAEFFEHFGFLTGELLRITKPGRLISVHCMDMPAKKCTDGYIGLKDFPGDIIREFEKHGFIYHDRFTIEKDPLIEAVRTRSLRLMYKQIQKDSIQCGTGCPDYILTFRAPGENAEFVSNPDGFSEYFGSDRPSESKYRGVKWHHRVWQKYANPIWHDIRQTLTLNKTSARAEKDEKHICPLQLDTIGRLVTLYTNENEVVFSPFMGIGSEGYQALLMKRRFIGVELKESYYEQACKNLMKAQSNAGKKTIMFMGEIQS